MFLVVFLTRDLFGEGVYSTPEPCEKPTSLEIECVYLNLETGLFLICGGLQTPRSLKYEYLGEL